jgi:glutaconate CoA-transferase subunit B
MASRQLRGVGTVFAGVGTPLLGAVLAQKTHTPGLIIVVEGGSIGAEVMPGRLPVSTNEMRVGYRAQMLPSITDTFLFAQRGYLDVGFVGGAQIDRYGNINTSILGPHDRPKLRLPGSGGANDILSLCRRVLMVTMHERRRFVSQVDFVTSPGFLDGGDSRRKAGLVFGRPVRVVTNLGMFGFDEDTKVMRLEALHQGVTVDQVIENTGFEPLIADKLSTIEPPAEEELRPLRSLDPDRRLL